MSAGSLLRSAAVSVLISAGGLQARALSWSGAAGATVIGTAVLGLAGWRGAAMLGGFFVSGSLLSRIAGEADTIAKGGERDIRQVFANGGVPALAALSAPVAGQGTALALLSGALSAATADTWATEWGMTSRQHPRLVISGRPVPRGLSGGVTMRGTLGGLAGAGASGALAAMVNLDSSDGPGRLRIGIATVLAGVAGSALDSVVGELLQEKRWSPAHRSFTETATYRGAPTVHAGGLKWVDNDLVNVACTLTGALVAAVALSAGSPASLRAPKNRRAYFRS